MDMGLNTIFGPSGILAIPMITSHQGILIGITIYSISLLIGYGSGFLSMLVGYKIFKNSSKVQWNLG
jgi:N-acetylmuramic acid-specific PTS system IIC component